LKKRLLALLILSGLTAAGAALAKTDTQGLQIQGLQIQGLQIQGTGQQGLQIQGAGEQGLQIQGVDEQGLQIQGLQIQGLQIQGLQIQGLQIQGVDRQGLQIQGLQIQGLQIQGLQIQGLQIQGLQIQGLQIQSNALQGLQIQGLQIQGSDLERSSAPGTFIFVPSAADPNRPMDLRNTFWEMPFTSGGQPNGHLLLFVSDVEKDEQLNSSKYPSNDDIYLYTVYYRNPATLQWASLCPVDPRSGKATAMAIPLDTHDWTSDTSRRNFTFACTASGVGAKCARNWGYKPWMTDVKERVWDGTAFVDDTISLAPFYDACLFAARADYCQDGQSYTRNGTLVDLFDTLDGLTSINATVGLPYAPNASGIMMHEEYQIATGSHVWDVLSDGQKANLSTSAQQLVQRLLRSGMESSRYPDLDPGRSCAAAPYIDRCDPKEPYSCYRATNLSAIPYGPFLAVNSSRHCSHDEKTPGEALDPLCNECVNRICKVDPTCCADPGTSLYAGSLVWDGRCAKIGDEVCRSVPGNDSNDRWDYGTPAPPATGGATTFLSGAIGSFERVIPGSGSGPIVVEGWSCDPDFPGSANPVQIAVGDALGTSGATLYTTTANQAIDAAWTATAREACGGGERHGFHVELPATEAGKDIYVYGIDLNVPGAPFSLLRGGKKPAARPAPHAAIWTGWFEPTESKKHTFHATAGTTDELRVWVNGTYVEGNWTDPAGTPNGFFLTLPSPRPAPYLQKGVRYGVRVEYLPVGSDSRFTLRWSTDGGTTLHDVGQSQLYPAGQGSGNGLEGSFFAGDFKGVALPATTPNPQTFGAVDKTWTDVSAPTDGVTVKSSFAARFAGQVVPPVSGNYTFTADTDGSVDIFINDQPVTSSDASLRPPGFDRTSTCSHDICQTGAAVSRTCQQGYFCASQICLVDPSCCAITWDGHCVEEVASVCNLNCSPTPPVPVALQAGVKYDIRVEYRHAVDAGADVRGAHLRLMWALPNGPRDVIPKERLFAATNATLQPFGAGINAAYFSDDTFTTEYLACVEPGLAFAHGAAPCASLGATMLDPAPPATSGAPLAPTLGLDHLAGLDATVRGGGASPRATVRIFELTDTGPVQRGGDIAIAANGSDGGSFTQTIAFTTRGAHALIATQRVDGVDSAASEPVTIVIPGLPPAPVARSTEVVTGNGSATVSGTGTIGATVKVTIGGTTYSTTVVDTDHDGIGDWTLSVTVGEYGITALTFLQESGGLTSEVGAKVNVKWPLPALIVTTPADGTKLPGGALTVSGFAPASLGEVIIEEGDGRYWVKRTSVQVDRSTGAFPDVPMAPIQLDYGRHLLRFHQFARDLAGDGVQRTVDVQPPNATLVIKQVASLGVLTDVPADPAPIIAGDLTVKGKGGLRRVCPDDPPTCANATGMPVRLRVYAGLTAADDHPTMIGEGTLADNGDFDVTVRLPVIGTRWISVSQVATSLSGGGSVESDRSNAVAVRGRPSQPTIVSPTSNDPPVFDRVAVVITGQNDVDHVVVTADPGIPARVVTKTINPTTPGRFADTVVFTYPGTYVLTAAAEADGALSQSSTPPVVVVVGDVTLPTVSDAAGQPIGDLPPVTAASPAESATVTFSARVYSADNGSARTLCLATGAPLPCTCLPESGSSFPLGTTSVTCSATDAAGNVGSTSFNVTVKSDRVPTVSGSDILAEAEGPAGAVVNYQVSASGYVANCAPAGSDGFEPCVAWKAAHEGLGFSPQAIAVDPFDGTLYAGFFGRYSEIDVAGAAGHLFRSPPGGESWTEIPGPLAGPIRQIAVGRGTPASLYVPTDPSWTSSTSQQGLWVSHDAGGHWSLALAGLNIAKVAIDPAYPVVDHLLVWTNVAGGGFPGSTSPPALYETFDGGATWASVAGNLPAVQILSAAMDPLNPGRTYVSVVPSASDNIKAQIWRRLGNEPWKKLFVPFDPLPANAIVNTTVATTLSVAPTAAPCVPAVTPCLNYPTLFGGAWMSFDGGENFVENPAKFGFAAMAFDRVGDPTHPGRVAYAVSDINILFRSLDYGRSWVARGQATAPVYANGSFVQDKLNANRYYAASSLGLFRSFLSPDDFSNPTASVGWTALPAPGLTLPGVIIKDLATDPVDPRTAYVVSDFGAFRTSNGDGKWSALNEGFKDPQTLQTLSQVLVDWFDRTKIYAGGRMGLTDPVWRMITSSPLPQWTRLQHTACTSSGDGCFNTVPPTATLRDASGRLTLDPLVPGNWISLAETNDSNNTSAILDSDAGPLRGTVLSQPSELSVWAALNPNSNHSPFAYRIQLVPDAERTMIISYATIGQPGLGQPPGGHDVLRYGSITPTPSPYHGGHWTGIAAANLVADSSDGVDRVFVGGAAIGRTATVLYRARVTDLRDKDPASVTWDELGGDPAFATTQFSTLAIDSASGGQHMYTLGGGDAAGTSWRNQLWESRDGGRHWQPDPSSPKYLSRIWVSPADGGVYGTVNPSPYDTSQLFLTSTSTFNTSFQPAGILWKREPVTGTPAGARITVGDLPVTCVYPPTVPDGDLRKLRAIGPGATFPVGTTTLDCTATDAFEHPGPSGDPFHLHITVQDTTPPVITVPAQVTGTVGTPVDYVATAKDLVDDTAIDFGCVPLSHTTFTVAGVQTVICTATDRSHNTATAKFSIAVSVNAPILIVPADITAEAKLAPTATLPAGANVDFDVHGTKANGSALASAPTCTRSTGPVASGDRFDLGTTVVDCEAVDGALRVTRSFRVTVKDTTAPAFDTTSIPNVTLPLGSPVSFTPVVTDIVTAAPEVSCSPASLTAFPLGKTTVTCRAADAAGNQSFAQFTVTMTDVNPPVLHLKDMLVQATDLTGAWVTYEPAPGFSTLAADVEDAAAHLVPDVTCIPSALPSTVPPEKLWFPIDPLPTTVTCTATDHAGNETTGSFNVQVVDAGKPTVTLKEDAPLSIEATGPDGAPVTFTVSASDLVDPTVSVACEAENGFGAVSKVSSGTTFPLGESKVTCRSTDDAGNTGELHFSIFVNDTKAPNLILPAPLPLHFGVDTSRTATVTFTVTATDTVTCPEGDLVRKCSVACTPRTGSQLLPGRTTVTCTARDAAGNESQSSFPIEVSGLGAPCTASSECGTGSCVDGVCCATACGNGATTDCQACSVAMGGSTDGTCTPVVPTHTCRPSAGVCDVAETCDGTSLACPADAYVEGTTCRDSAGTCDPAETCTGTSAACPADVKASAGTTCRPSAGDCDVDDVCDGASAACPVDVRVRAGTTCRPATTVCDVAEVCNGTSAVCPPDAFAPPSTQCHASAGLCDPAETCTGTSAACPADRLSPRGTTCRLTAGSCDVTDVCDGMTAACPDMKVSQGTQCRASAGACDPAEVCDGASNACPPDARLPAGTTCRPAATVCDLPEACDGTAAACPTDTFAPPTTQCRASAGACDPAEMCTGTSATCPTDQKSRAGTICRASAGACDVAEACDGTASACPPDAFVPSGQICGGTCANPARCSGNSATCPGPTPAPICHDTTPPVISGVPTSPYIAYATSTSGAAVTYKLPTAVDDVDGPVPVICDRMPGANFPVGTKTVACHASDSSGNTSYASFVVWVQYQAPGDGTFFLKPIRPDNTSVFKIGRAVPVKFQLFGASAGITNLVARLVVTKLSSTVSGNVDCVGDEDGDDTDMIFKYRKAKGIYGYRWKTSNQTKGTYLLRADLGDGVTHEIKVSLKVSQ